MIRRPPRSTRTDTLFPYTTLFRSEIKGAINKLDNVPLQVQIETRILEVSLTGEFQFGVQWYLEGLTGSTGTPGSDDFSPGQPYRPRQLGLGQGGTAIRGEPIDRTSVV